MVRPRGASSEKKCSGKNRLKFFRRIRTSVIPENRMRILLRSKALGLFIKYQRCRLDYSPAPACKAKV